MGDNKITIKNNIFQNNTIMLLEKYFPSHLMKPMLMTWQKLVIY